MALNLIPMTGRKRGGHGEQLNTALADQAIAKALDLCLAIDNGTDKCLKAWLLEKDMAGEAITHDEIEQILDGIYAQANAIHTAIVGARQPVQNNQ